ncbi:Protein FAM26E [Collichthys lucidus]|uniref:Protein FAM26E n=1 Tax=Collichthys lucidus TaxID=240159 RepID=A0A4U5V1F6_COLLU|nr:Protein FAM26E [Collichthys lucidus]
MVFLLVPALALLLLGYILSKKTWKLFTGLCYRRAQLCHWRKLAAAGNILFHISTIALVAPSTWIAVALLNGIYFECAMTGINVKAYRKQLCEENGSLVECQKKLYSLPCKRDNGEVLLTLKAVSQVSAAPLLQTLFNEGNKIQVNIQAVNRIICTVRTPGSESVDIY